MIQAKVGDRVTILAGERAGRQGIVIAESAYGPEQLSVELTPGEFYLESTSNLRTWAGMMDAEKEGVVNNLEYAYENMKQASNTLRAHGYENEAGDIMELASSVLHRMSLIRNNL